MEPTLTQTAVPSTQRVVVLKCIAPCCATFTNHTFVRYSNLGDVRHVVFECAECSTERQYGCEGRV